MARVRSTVQVSSKSVMPPTFSDTVDFGGGTMKILAREDSDKIGRKAQGFELPGIRKNSTQVLADKAIEVSRKPKALGNLGEMHKQILVWDYPPNTRSVLPPHFEKDRLSVIPKTFKTSREYSSVFEPLLILEIWAQFCQSADQNDRVDTSLVAKIDSVLAVDDFYQLSMTTEGRNGRKIQDLDLVQFCEVRVNDPTMNAGSKPIVAIIDSCKVKFDTAKIVARIYPSNRRTDIISRLRPGSKWRFAKILSLITVHREYTAMLNIPMNSMRFVKRVLILVRLFWIRVKSRPYTNLNLAISSRWLSGFRLMNLRQLRLRVLLDRGKGLC